MESNTPDRGKIRMAVIITVVIILAITLFVVVSNRSCASSSSKIEVIQEPRMTMVAGSLGYRPRVTATVKNKTNSTIKVQLSCSIYDRNGHVTKNISSSYITLAGGETTTLVAESYVDYSIIEYSTVCASFGNVEYKFL